MLKPDAGVQQLCHGVPPLLQTPVRVPAQVEQLPALPQLDLLWHYDCVVIPTSSRSPASRFQAPSLPLALALAPAPKHHVGLPPPPLSYGSNAVHSSSSHSEPAVCTPQSHQRQALQRVFNTFDANGDGTVSVDEICRIFDRLGIEYSVESLLASLITETQGQVAEQEFLSLYEAVCCSDVSSSSSSLQADVDQDLMAAFRVFDKDDNGFISPAELQSVLLSLGFPQGRQLEACVDMIARVDENGDGHVDFVEFRNLFRITSY